MTSALGIPDTQTFRESCVQASWFPCLQSLHAALQRRLETLLTAARKALASPGLTSLSAVIRSSPSSSRRGGRLP